MLKKLTPFIICLCLVCSMMLTMVSCGNEEVTTSPEGTPSETSSDAQTDEETKNDIPVPTEKDTSDNNDDDMVECSIFVSDIYDGAPIPGITVELYNKGNELVISQTTDADGRVSFTVLDTTYTVKLSNVPDNYTNEEEGFLFQASSHELEIRLMDPSDYPTDGRDEEHRADIYNKEEMTVGAGQTLYMSAPKAPGYIMTLYNADGLKIVYNEKEYTAEDGVIVVEFEEQSVGSASSMPNDFIVINNGNEDYSEVVSILSKDAGQNRDSAFELDLGENTTPEFIPGTSASDHGVTTYYYVFIPDVNGVFSVASDNAVISIYLKGNETPLVDENGEYVRTVEVEAHDNIIIAVSNPDSDTNPVSFISSFT